MRAFKLDNVIKKTDNEAKIKKYLEQGFEEITEKKQEKNTKKAPAKKADNKEG